MLWRIFLEVDVFVAIDGSGGSKVGNDGSKGPATWAVSFFSLSDNDPDQTVYFHGYLADTLLNTSRFIQIEDFDSYNAVAVAYIVSILYCLNRVSVMRKAARLVFMFHS